LPLPCMLFAGTAHYPLRSSAPSNAQALTASRPDATFQFFPNRNRAAMRWSVMLGSLLDAFPLSAETDSVTRAFDRCLNFDPFDFLERKFLAGAIVEFWRGDSWFPMVWASSTCAIIPPQRFSSRKQRKKPSLAVLGRKNYLRAFPAGPYSNFSQGCSRRPTRSIANACMDVGRISASICPALYFHALGLHLRRFMRRRQNEKILATLRARRRKP
jgi:hypothetical protein